MASDLPWVGWHHSSAFCSFASDRPITEGYVVYVTNPEEALDWWHKHGFNDIARWGEEGFEGIYHTPSGKLTMEDYMFWILSPEGE